MSSDQEQGPVGLRLERPRGAGEQRISLRAFPDQIGPQNRVGFVLPSACLRAFPFCPSLGLKRWLDKLPQEKSPWADRTVGPAGIKHPYPLGSSEGRVLLGLLVKVSAGLVDNGPQVSSLHYSFNPPPPKLLLWVGSNKIRAEVSPTQGYSAAPAEP